MVARAGKHFSQYFDLTLFEGWLPQEMGERFFQQEEALYHLGNLYNNWLKGGIIYAWEMRSQAKKTHEVPSYGCSNFERLGESAFNRHKWVILIRNDA